MPPQTKKASRAGARKKAAPSDRPPRKAPAKRGSVPVKASRGKGKKPVKARRAQETRPPRKQAPKAPAVAANDGGVQRIPPVPQAAVARKVEEAEHMHRDPRWTQPKMDAKWKRAKHDPRKEGGLSKDRQVRRMQPVTNWYRQAPKPKGTSQ